MYVVMVVALVVACVFTIFNEDTIVDEFWWDGVPVTQDPREATRMRVRQLVEELGRNRSGSS